MEDDGRADGTSVDDLVRYDEGQLTSRLSSLGREARTTYAALCAERLLPLFRRYVGVSGTADGPALRAALDRVWQCLAGEAPDTGDAASVAEAQVPSGEGEWVHESGYAQNAAAAVAYAALTWEEDDAQQAVWAARQVYEAADHAAQQVLPGAGLGSEEGETVLLAHPWVQAALRALASDLGAVESAEAEVPVLRRTAARQGETWAASLP